MDKTIEFYNPEMIRMQEKAFDRNIIKIIH